MQLGVAHCYLLGISQTLCRGVHLSARPSSRSLLSLAALSLSFSFSLSPPFLPLASNFSPRLSSFYRRFSSLSSLFLGTLSLFRSLESAFCHKYVYYLLLAIKSKEPRPESAVAVCAMHQTRIYKCTRARRARIYAWLAANLPRISSTKWYGSPLRSESKRVADSTHFGRRNSSRFDLVLPTRSIDNSDLVDRWCADIVNTFCYKFVVDVTRADRRDVGFSLVPMLFPDVMLDLETVFNQLITTWCT